MARPRALDRTFDGNERVPASLIVNGLEAVEAGKPAGHFRPSGLRLEPLFQRRKRPWRERQDLRGFWYESFVKLCLQLPKMFVPDAAFDLLIGSSSIFPKRPSAFAAESRGLGKVTVTPAISQARICSPWQ